MPEICTLDIFREEDKASLIELFTSVIGREFLGGPIAFEVALERIKQWTSLSASEPLWAIRDGKNQKFLGYVSLSEHHEDENIEISYELLPRYWGNGYATHALIKALLRASRNYGLKEVIAETQSSNYRSIKLLKRIGMVEKRRLIRFGEEQTIFLLKLNGGHQI